MSKFVTLHDRRVRYLRSALWVLRDCELMRWEDPIYRDAPLLSTKQATLVQVARALRITQYNRE